MKFEPTLHKLSNGVTVILDPMDMATASIKVSFATGSRDEAPHEYGLTHFCEHMLCKGTPRFPNKRAINEYLDYHGAFRNASTGLGALNFYGRVLAENINILVDYIGDQLKNSLFDSKKIELERNVICDELRRDLDNPNSQLNTFISEKLFGNQTSATRILGTVDTIMSFTREQMLEFLARRLSATNCIIAISGRIIDRDDLLRQLEASFAFLPTHDVARNTFIPYAPCIAHNSKPENNNVRLQIIFPDVWPHTYDNRFYNMSLGRFERFMTKEISNILRQDNGLVYGFGVSGIGNYQHSWNAFGTQTSAQNLPRVVALIAQHASQIYNNPKITPEVLDRFNRKDKLSEADWLESATARCDKLLTFYRNHERLYDFYDMSDIFNHITVDDAIKYSRGYFDGQMSIITQGADFDCDLKQIWNDNFK